MVIPTYQEGENVPILIPRLFKYIKNISILVVDDGSPDGTAEICREISKDYPSLFVERRAKKSGLGGAYRHGFKWGLERSYEEFIEIDADMSHRVRDLAEMLKVKEKDPGIGLVIGSRWRKGGAIVNWSWRRQLLSRAANIYVRIMLGMGINDSTAGFRIYSAELLRKIPLQEIKSEGYSFQIEMTRAAKLAGAKIVEVPITFRERESGVSKMSGAIVREAMILVTVWGLKRFFRLK
ncbi:MAG: polyprenol monophosphomannose synthase [Actinobacteria bacterium]|nr:polyprenol monophosphomannose synthase [Actinomycetota bacterium]